MAKVCSILAKTSPRLRPIRESWPLDAVKAGRDEAGRTEVATPSFPARWGTAMRHAMTSVATFRGSLAMAASNSAEKTWVAAPGIGLRSHGARASGAEVGLASLDGSLEIRRHLHLVFEPLLQPFPQLLGIFHREQRDCGFNFCDRAHGRHSSFCEFPLQAGRSRDPQRSGGLSINRGSESANGAKVAADRAAKRQSSDAGAKPEQPVCGQVGAGGSSR